jgi:hypothetical protein
MLLRFRDLEQYGVRNWMTLRRWQEKHGAPIGFYLGERTRVWRKADWDKWLAERPTTSNAPLRGKARQLAYHKSELKRLLREDDAAALDAAERAVMGDWSK